MTIANALLMAASQSGPFFQTDFSEYTTGVQPTGWTTRGDGGTWTVVNSGDIGGKCLRKASGGSNANRMITWNIADNISPNVETLVRVRSNAFLGTAVGPCARQVGSVECYAAPLADVSGAVISSVRMNSGGTFSDRVDQSKSWSANTWYWIRQRVIGNDIKIKMWAGAVGSEPSSWDIETTNSTLTDAGRVGLYTRRPDQHDCDFFSVAFNGGKAKSP